MATTEALIHPTTTTTTTATTTLSDDSIDQSTTTNNTLTIPTITTTLSNNNYHHNNSSNAHDVTQSTTTTNHNNNNHQKMTSSFNLSVQIPTSSSSHHHHQHQQSQQHATIRSNNHHTMHPSTDTMMMMDSDVIHVTESVIFRTIRREDLSDLHHLQLELFPVRYKDDFYQSLLVKDNTLTILAIHRQTRKLIGVCSCRVYEHDTGSALLSWIYEFLSSIVSANGSFVGLSRSDNNRQNQSVQKQQQEQQYNDRFGYIMTLGVTRSYRRQGLASQMVEILIRKMVEKPYYCSSLTLHCKVDNERALKFYHKHGFIVEDRVRDYYDFAGVREDAFHLVKHLSLPEISHDGITPIDIHQQQPRSSSTLEAEQKREQSQWIQRYGYTFGWISIFCAWIVALFFKLTEVFEEHWLSLCSAMTTTTTSTSTAMTTNSASASISSASSSASSFASSTGAPSFATQQQQQHNKRIMTNHNSAHGHHRSNRSHVTT